LRQVYEAALQRRGVRTIILDEAQHLLKLSSGVKLIDQLDWLKSMTNTTGVLHILTGTYALLPLRNLNGQAARRGLEIHFPRYQFQHEPDQLAFQRALLTLLQQIPLKVEGEQLLQQWPYFYERCIGCVGVLKDWLVRALAATIADGQTQLLIERIAECALPLAQCESMAIEAAAGEQGLHYTASRRQHLLTLLGMNMGVEGVKEQIREGRVENCSFSGATVALQPAQLAAAGIEKLQCPECGSLPKCHLPVPLTPLVGREREIAAISVLLSRPEVRLVSLTGTGGVGKTRLALKVVAASCDFADGICFVALAALTDPGLVASTIAQTLSVLEQGSQPLLDTLKDHLRDKELLLLLDNFEQVVSAAPVVAELLAAAPRLRVLVTSRTSLHLSGEHEFVVPPLSLPDLRDLPPLDRLTHFEAVRLFIERAQAACGVCRGLHA
jgi:NB-ARC domain